MLAEALWDDRTLSMEQRIHSYLRAVLANEVVPPWLSSYALSEINSLSGGEVDWWCLHSVPAEFTILPGTGGPGATFIYRLGECLFRWESGLHHSPWDHDAR